MEFKTIIEPFKIKMVEPLKLTTRAERESYLIKANYNTFQLDSDQVLLDFLTDSGTSAMSAEQWAGIMQGDESYAGASSYHHMHDVISDLTGMEFIFPTHQGRAGERILYSLTGGKGKTFISNTHFDTTRANIEFSGAEAIDIPIPEGVNPMQYHPFKGNMDIAKLRELIDLRGASQIGGVVMTVTNNSGGGQPVSMANLREVSAVCREHEIRLYLDCCRVAENAWFIHDREDEFKDVPCYKIAQEMFSYCDGAVMSAKKDALVNMGGFLAVRDKSLAEECKNLLIITEGFTTYGGLSGRDMEAMAIGLKEVFDHDYLRYRIRSTAYLGERLHSMGVPLIWPIGGHAVYIDAKALYPHIPVTHYPGQSLVCQLYLLGGIRSCEIGSVMFGKYNESGQLIPAPMELVRLAIPRRVYTQSHIEFVIEVFGKILQNKEQAFGLKITEEPKFLRHFTSKFDRMDG